MSGISLTSQCQSPNPPRPIIGCDTGGFTPNIKHNPTIFGMPVGCDLPEQGGISGNLRPHEKLPYVCYTA